MKKCGLTRSQQTQKYLKLRYHQYKINVRKEKFYVWSEYAKSKGLSMYALIQQVMDEKIAAEGFVPEIPYEETVEGSEDVSEEVSEKVSENS